MAVVKPANPAKFVHVALVLATEFAYARGVLRGIIAATRQRNMYTSGSRGGGQGDAPPWLFRVYRGIYGHSIKYLRRWFADWNPDGVIGEIYDDRLARFYRETGKPVVELFEGREHSEFPRIMPDDVATGTLAAKYFLDRGFRHFAFYGAPWMPWSRERETGFRNEISRVFNERAKVSADGHGSTNGSGNSRFTYSSYSVSGVAVQSEFGQGRKRSVALVGAYLASLPRPLALFAANDSWGIELLQAVREIGLRVPDDIAILGVDNEELLCEIAHPPLSSIRMGAEQIGHEAVRLLERLLEGKPAGAEIARVPPQEIITRQSTDVLAVEDPDTAAALRHIRQHAAEGLSVKQLLDAIPTNRRTLERRFISILGHTPLEEIRRVRLERAKARLQTDMPIYDVAMRSGFATPEYFATSFFQSTAMTPTDFRRQFSPRTRWQRLPPA